MDALIDEGTAVSAAPVTAPPFDIADEIAEAVGGPVIVEDASFRVVGYSAFVGPMDRGRVEAILGRHIPPAWLAHLTETGSLDRLRSTRDVVDLRDGPWQAHRRLITAFRAGERVLGFAWVAEGERPLGDGAAAALRRAVDDATPRLLRHLEQIDAAQAHAFREVDALLDGLPGAPAVAARLGLDRAGRFAVLAVSATGSPETDALALRLVEHLRLCLGSLRRRAAFTAHGDRALAVVALTEDDAADAARRLAGDVVRLAGKGPLHPLQAAVSSVGHGVASVPVLRDQALAAASVHAGTGGCIAFADVEAEVLVAEVVASLPPATRLEGLDRLREADRGSGELERTLRAYLAACGSASGAARDLGVHVTTVRHRLDRITTVSGLRLDRPDVRVACELMLRRAGA